MLPATVSGSKRQSGRLCFAPLPPPTDDAVRQLPRCAGRRVEQAAVGSPRLSCVALVVRQGASEEPPEQPCRAVRRHRSEQHRMRAGSTQLSLGLSRHRARPWGGFSPQWCQLTTARSGAATAPDPARLFLLTN